MKIPNKHKNNFKDFILILIICGGVSFGLSTILPFWHTASVLLSVQFIIWKYFNFSEGKDLEISKIEEEFDSYKTFVEEEFGKFTKTIDEQLAVIKDYEDIFDNQLVELPCICGGNTFKGLFSPKDENIVQCEKCKNNYKVKIDYDSILISDNHNV